MVQKLSKVRIWMCLVLVCTIMSFQVHPSPEAAAASAKVNTSHYDVVVIGSEIEGVLLAKSAYQLGLKVLILDPREKPGGQLLQGKMLVLDEPNTNKKISLVQGEMKKLYDAYNAGQIRKDADFERYYSGLIKGIPRVSGIQILKVTTKSVQSVNSISSLTFQKKNKSILTIDSKYWVENTDYGALTSKLGVKRIPGVESIFGGKEPEYMAATYMLKFKNVNWLKLHNATIKEYPLNKLEKKYGPNTYVDYNFGTGFSNITNQYKASDAQLRLRGINSTFQKNGEVIMNALLIYDVNPADPVSVNEAIRKGKAEAPKVLKFLQKNIPGYEHAQLNGYPDYLYIRDYNRYETDYVLQYEDIMAGKMFWDNVSLGGYPADIQGTRKVPYGKGYGSRTDMAFRFAPLNLKALIMC